MSKTFPRSQAPANARTLQAMQPVNPSNWRAIRARYKYKPTTDLYSSSKKNPYTTMAWPEIYFLVESKYSLQPRFIFRFSVSVSVLGYVLANWFSESDSSARIGPGKKFSVPLQDRSCTFKAVYARNQHAFIGLNSNPARKCQNHRSFECNPTANNLLNE